MFQMTPDHPLYFVMNSYMKLESCNNDINGGLDQFGKDDISSTIKWISIAYPEQTHEALVKHGVSAIDLDNELFAGYDRELGRNFNYGVPNAGAYFEDEGFHFYLQDLVGSSFKEFYNFGGGFVVSDEQLAGLSTSDFCQTMLELSPELRAEVELRELEANTAQIPDRQMSPQPRWPTRPRPPVIDDFEADTAMIEDTFNPMAGATQDPVGYDQEPPRRSRMRL